MIREKLNQLIEDISKVQPMDQVYQARKEYQALSGEIFEDDTSYEARMGLFLEWFTFDYPVQNGKTPLEVYLDTHAEFLSPEDRELFEGFKNSRHSLFLLKKNSGKHIVVLDLFEDEKLRVSEEDGRFFFSKDDIFEARLLPYRDQFYFTENFCHHPKETYKYISSKVRPLRSAEAKDHKELKKMYKNWQSMKKQIDAITRKIEKLTNKIQKTDSEKKRESLGEEMDRLKTDKLQWEVRFFEHQNKIEDWEVHRIRLGHKTKRFHLMRQLSYMSLKWERYHNVDVLDLYRD